MRFFFRNLNIEKKFLTLVIFAVVLAIATLTILVGRRESNMIRSQHGRYAEALANLIGISLRDNMLAGRIDDTIRLIRELRRSRSVDDVAVLGHDGKYAFGLSGPSIGIDRGIIERLDKGTPFIVLRNHAMYLLKPLLNDEQCRHCHREDDRIRGIVVVKVSTADVGDYINVLIERMSAFGIVTVTALTILLAVLGRSMLLSPIRGLTDATRQLALGNFVMHKPRSTRCHEILRCEKKGCPSHDNAMIPCWLQSGTLCDGEPKGTFAIASGNCRECVVYRRMKGDELVQLQDYFNRMSLTLKMHEENNARHICDIKALNQELTKSNMKLTTLLDASRLTTSTLELEKTLSTSLKIILDSTSLKVGVILLLEEDLSRTCYEFFSCDAHNCPAFKTKTNCWRLAGTMCHGEPSTCPGGRSAVDCWIKDKVHTHLVPALNYETKLLACSSCEFFSSTVLIPKMISGFTNGHIGKRLKIDSATLHNALLMGQVIINYSGENPLNIPIPTITEVAIPLRMRDETAGILYLASDKAHRYGEEEIEFFQYLADVIATGIFNSRLYGDIETSYLQTITALANAIEAKDPYTRGHSERVAKYCDLIAESLQLSSQEREHLKFAAFLHDVGKIAIGRDVLWKSRSLSIAEAEEMRSHPEKGVQILAPVHFLRPVIPAIRHHHERFDGGGYPDGLKGREIPFKARILCVADAWDAMRSDRPYRDALSVELAKEQLTLGAGAQFDPEVVRCFIEMV